MKIRPLWVILSLILIGAIVVGLPVFSKLKRYQAEADQVGTRDLDLTNVADGVYKGSYDSGLVVVEIEVTVSDHHITKIDLIRHQNGKGKAAEVMPEKVIAAQSLKVDVVTGATMSSKVILLAIEDALTAK